MHNHPSGEATPPEADTGETSDLIRAGQLMKTEVLDHVIMGNPKHSSLRELGYCAELGIKRTVPSESMPTPSILWRGFFRRSQVATGFGKRSIDRALFIPKQGVNPPSEYD